MVRVDKQADSEMAAAAAALSVVVVAAAAADVLTLEKHRGILRSKLRTIGILLSI
jgi:hypothetical protein